MKSLFSKASQFVPFAALALSAGLAVSSAYGAEGSKPCAEDAARFCSGLTWGKGLGKCLKQHEAEISPACQTRLTQVREKRSERHEKRKELRQACRTDVKQFCGDVQKGKGRMVSCLKNNSEKLSESCRNELNTFSSQLPAPATKS